MELCHIVQGGKNVERFLGGRYYAYTVISLISMYLFMKEEYVCS